MTSSISQLRHELIVDCKGEVVFRINELPAGLQVELGSIEKRMK